MVTIAVFNPRPGAGKTTTAVHLLAAIGGRGQRPWGIDLDPAAHLSTLFDVLPRRADESVDALFTRDASLADIAHITRSGVVVCPAHADLGAVTGKLGKGLDVLTRLRRALRQPGAVTGPVVIDCGSTIDTVSLNGVFACDLMLVPVSCDLAGVRGAGEAGRMLSAFEPVFKRRLPRRYVLTRYDGTGTAAEVVERLGAMVRAEEVCGTRIRFDPEVAAGSAASLEAMRNAKISTEDYERLLDELETANPTGPGGWRIVNWIRRRRRALMRAGFGQAVRERRGIGNLAHDRISPRREPRRHGVRAAFHDVARLIHLAQAALRLGARDRDDHDVLDPLAAAGPDREAILAHQSPLLPRYCYATGSWHQTLL